METYEIVRTKVAPDRLVVFISMRGLEFGTSCYGKNESEINSEIQYFANATGARLDAEKAKQDLADAL